MEIYISSTVKVLNGSNEEINILTHDGMFHSDEVFASAFVIHFIANNKKTNIFRSRDNQLIELFKADDTIFTLDIGSEYRPSMKNFDHHQDDEEVAEVASVMLILNYLYETSVISTGLYNHFKDNLVQFLSNWDLGLEQDIANYWHKPLPTIISAFNRFKGSQKEKNLQFEKALRLALSIIENEIESFNQLLLAKEGFKKHRALSKELVLFDDFNPQYARLLKQCQNIKYYVHPMKENWVVKTTNSFVNPLPLIDNTNDLVFAHKSRFLSIFNSQKAAIDYISKESILCEV